MKKVTRWCLCLLIIGLILNIQSPILAIEPKPLDILSESEIPDAIEGQSHYLLICANTYSKMTNRLSGTGGILIVTLDTNRAEIMLTSIMSNELVQCPDGEIRPLSNITRNFGVEALVDIIGSHYGIKVDKYFLVNYTDTINIIDAMDGIDLDLSTSEIEKLDAFSYWGYTMPDKLENGKYHCQGRLVVYYMRSPLFEGGDLGNTIRMCAIVTKVAEKVNTFDMNSTLSLLVTIRENVTKTNCSMNEIMNIASMVMKMIDNNIRQLQLPQLDDIQEFKYGSKNTYEVDFAACRQKLHAFLLGE